MPILYVNPAGGRGPKTVRVSGSARVSLPGRARARRNPTRVGAGVGQRAARPANWYGPVGQRTGDDGDDRPTLGHARRRRPRQFSRTRVGMGVARPLNNPAKKKRKSTMAKRRSNKRNKRGRFTKRRARSRRSAANLGHRRKRRKARLAAPKRRRRARKAAPARKRRYKRNPAPKKRRKGRKGGKRSAAARKAARTRARNKAMRRAAALKGRRRRRKHGTGNYKHRLRGRAGRAAAGPVFRRSQAGKGRKTRMSVVRRGPKGTLMLNPSRRRRRKGGRRRSSRRIQRRYRRNGGAGNLMRTVISLVKRAIPVVAGFYGTRFIATRLANVLPGVPAQLAGPLASAGMLVGLNFATDKVSFLRKYKTELMMGATINVIDSVFRAFAPDAVKQMIGMGDDIYGRGLSEYVGTGEYVGVGGIPLDDDIAMNGYIAVSGDGAEEELGMDEELGALEEMGADEAMGAAWDAGGNVGGLSQSAFTRRVPTQAFAREIPARSFSRQIPAANGRMDNPGQLYVGTFGGGFGN